MPLEADRIYSKPATLHAPILRKRLVRPHRRNLVSEKAQRSRALDRFGAIAGAEL